MPVYKSKCSKCGDIQEVYLGKITNGDLLDMSCKSCGNPTLQKIASPISSATFSKGSSKRSLKTRTGVGELIMKQGSAEAIRNANK